MLTFGLSAKNSESRLHLLFSREEGSEEIDPTIIGVHEGRDIQIDFDPLTDEEIDDLIHLLKRQKQGGPE